MNYNRKQFYLSATLFSFLLLPSNSFAFDQDTLYLCKGDGIKYQNITKLGKAVAWFWTFQSGSDDSGNPFNSSTDSAPPPVFYNSAGIFVTTIKTTFSTGEDSTDKIMVVVRDWPMNNFYFPTDTGYCAGGSFSLTLNTTSFPGLVYTWSTGATSSSISVNSPGTYSVKLEIKAGSNVCQSLNKSVNVTEYPSPKVYLGQDKFMCQNQVINLDAGAAPAGDVYSYSWQPNNEVTRTIGVSLPGIYGVRVTNKYGCYADDQVEFADSCPHFVFVPNAFSPNEDHLNDLFVKVWNFTPKEYTFRIFNRWGELLFETNDINAGWDARVSGTTVEQDVYVYKITYQDNDRKWYELRGTFFVVR